VQATVAALKAQGFEAARADSASGLVSTKRKLTEACSPELAGKMLVQFVAEVESMEQGSLVTVEFIMESGSAHGWAPASVSWAYARVTYARLFQDIQAQLEATGSILGGA
jgi:hypothetical protein